MRRHDEQRRAPADPSGILGFRVQGEFNEMPGLCLTPLQAARLWALDRATSERVLDTLAATGFLAKRADGAYLRRS